MTQRLLVLSLLGLTGLWAQNPNDQNFINEAAQVDMTDAHLGQMAQQKGTSPAVRDFGRMIAQDHQQNYQSLTQNSQGFNVPKSIDAQHQTAINQLNSLSGPQFDNQFVRTIMQQDQQSLAHFQNASNNLQNSNLRNYVSNSVGMMQRHLQAARGVETQLSNNGQPGNNAQNGGYQAATSNLGQPGDQDQPGAAPSDNGSMHYGVVTSYEPGRRLVIKTRDRAGEHVYDLSNSRISAEVPANMKVGDEVTIQESTNQANGRQRIRVTEGRQQ